MLIIILGFGLLIALILGIALLLLSLLFLGVSMGLQFLIVLAGLAPGGGLIISLASGIQLAAGAAFVLALLLIGLGLLSLLFPAVRIFLRGVVTLLRLASNGVQSIELLVPLFRTAADAINGGGNIFTSSASQTLLQLGDGLIDTGNAFPEIPTVQPNDESLWLKFDQNNNRTEGFLPKPPLVPDVNVVTSLSIGQAPIQPVVNGLIDSGNLVKNFGQGAENVGNSLKQTATALNDIADLLEQAGQ